MLPPTLAEHANLNGIVEFMGTGRSFQMWEPAAAERRRAEARENTRNRKAGLAAAAA